MYLEFATADAHPCWFLNYPRRACVHCSLIVSAPVGSYADCSAYGVHSTARRHGPRGGPGRAILHGSACICTSKAHQKHTAACAHVHWHCAVSSVLWPKPRPNCRTAWVLWLAMRRLGCNCSRIYFVSIHLPFSNLQCPNLM